MAIFGKQFQSPSGGDAQGRLAALEEHIRYMQEQMEYQQRQTEKRLGELGKAVPAAEKTADTGIRENRERLALLEERVADLETLVKLK